MSGLTGYTVSGGQDLSAIFQPIGTLTPVSATGYTVKGKDLSNIFAGVSNGTQISYDTGYIVNNESYSNIDLRQIFSTNFTNGKISYNNPLSNTTTSGWKYILFNTISSTHYFNNVNTINTLYYMIVGAGGNGKTDISSGAGGGAGGCYNGSITNFPSGNYSITIPDTTQLLSVIFKNSVSPNLFTISAKNGEYGTRGSVDMSFNNTSSVLYPSSSTSGEMGVGTAPPSQVKGGNVFVNPSNSGNYLTFLGDNLVSNTLFGGGGGRGAPNILGTVYSGYDGCGGGGGAGINSNNTAGIRGGSGVNGNSGGVSTTSGGKGGDAFSGIGNGYGGGGGGGGGVSLGNYPAGAGGKGGPGMLLLYFQYP